MNYYVECILLLDARVMRLTFFVFSNSSCLMTWQSLLLFNISLKTKELKLSLCKRTMSSYVTEKLSLSIILFVITATEFTRKHSKLFRWHAVYEKIASSFHSLDVPQQYPFLGFQVSDWLSASHWLNVWDKLVWFFAVCCKSFAQGPLGIWESSLSFSIWNLNSKF